MTDSNRKKEKMAVLGEGPNGTFLTARTAGTDVELVYIKPVTEGQSILPGQNVIHYEKDAEGPLYSYEHLTGSTPTSSGPARVNSRAYRNGWDEIFGQKTTKEMN